MDLSQNDSEIEDRFFLLGRMEIINCLNDLIRQREPLTVYFNQGKDFILTTLLEAGAEHVLFDLGGDPRANRRLESSTGNCVMVAVQNGIRIQFSVPQAPRRFSWGGADAFEVPLPARIVRMQRRESYRVTLPVKKPVMAKITNDSGVLICELPIHDLSVGGAGLNAVDQSALAEGDEVDISFPLGEGQVIRNRAKVRHVTQVGSTGSHPLLRVGLCFLRLPVASSARLQRFILQVEHQRSALVQKR
ncbi:flagellar brake protein [Noviherbaspirillum galbum]|uniref:Flagellar brake protein YcgR n=1 Tax=Noviherbaspirillum galbum TaxID=2709383 RepID=A0A6B3SG87_9BURK|nr:flagellar brake protein [Noviherbaspirillum galbum]NEX59613.1 flagellar brake protein [Noviherbaspirillum galbum]